MDSKFLPITQTRTDASTAALGARSKRTADARAAPPETAGPPMAGRAAAEAGESVTLSGAMPSLAGRDAPGERAVPFDEARVAEIRKAIADGQYPIDNQRLAQQIIQFEQQLA